jgi:cytoskeletal protein CcmA (bactofilin family)
MAMFSNNKNRRGPNELPAMTESPRVAAVSNSPVMPAPSGVPSIISSDMTVRGNLQSSGRLQIEGTVVGDIDVAQLVVADGAVIQGEITADSVEISGALTGLIRAHEITLKSSARVVGDVYYEVLTMEPRSELEGQCRRTPSASQTQLQITKDISGVANDDPPSSSEAGPPVASADNP